MKFICLQENLNKGLFLVNHLTLKNLNLPILNNVLIQAKNNIITLITTNLEIGIQCQIRGKVQQEGECIIPCQLLVNYVGLLPNQPIEIEIKNSKLFLECNNQKTQINGVNFTEFPILPKLKNQTEYFLNIINFKKALEQTIPTITFNELRPEISGALLDFNTFRSNWLTMAGTDSFQIAEKKIPFQQNSANEKKQVIIPLKTCQELLRILPEEENEIVKICVDTNQIYFSFQNTELVSRTIEGKFPDYPQIIPKEYRTRAIFNGSEFIKGIKRQSLFASEKRALNIELSFLKQEMLIFSGGAMGESSSIIKGEIQGEDNIIALDYKYLLNGIQSLKSEEVILEIINKKQPLILKSSKEEKNYFYFIFPLVEKE
ncbi:DNA polymerase III subunit beta [Candidatus Kuenenbacteria bacterium]|nr:DNA polymerase III subunit beta [Candidatus Kuenenbacteria bacterium]